MYLNEILPGNWREDEWPEHIEVSHESSRFKSRRYVPRVNSANKSSANPVDGIWCSHCGWAEGSDAMTHFGIAFILANIFELRSEMGKIGEK